METRRHMACGLFRPGDDVLLGDRDQQEEQSDHNRHGQQPNQREQEHEDSRHEHRRSRHGHAHSRELDNQHQDDHNDEVHGDDDQDFDEDKGHEEDEHDDVGYNNPIQSPPCTRAKRHPDTANNGIIRRALITQSDPAATSTKTTTRPAMTAAIATTQRHPEDDHKGHSAALDIVEDTYSLGVESQGTDFKTNGADNKVHGELGWGQPPSLFSRQRLGRAIARLNAIKNTRASFGADMGSVGLDRGRVNLQFNEEPSSQITEIGT